MHKVGIIGDRDSILGFEALGISTWPVTDRREVEGILQKLAGEGYGLIFITEEFVGDAAALVKYGARRLPAVIPIPGRRGPDGSGKMGLRKAVERAVGADILFRDG